MSSILKAREQRSHHIKKMMNTFLKHSVVVLKTNEVGQNKNIVHMCFLLHLFDHLIQEMFPQSIIEQTLHKSVDGNYILYIINQKGNDVKEQTITLEEDHILGRLVDIDVYQTHPIKRDDLEHKTRRCLLCDEDAHVCTRNKTHTEKEIHNHIKTMIQTYLLDKIRTTVIKSIYHELELYPKYGLVSSHDSGAHHDMDMETFIRSTFAIIPYILDYIKFALQGQTDVNNLITIGKKAERTMFETTNGVNTQKGLIFALGLFLPAIVKGILQHQSESEIQDSIKQYAKEVIGNYYIELYQKESLSHGDVIFKQYGLKGIRGEALLGFPLVFETPHYNDTPLEFRHHNYLLEMMRHLDDTTIIHRHNLKTLKEVQETADFYLKNGGFEANQEAIQQLSSEYKERGISPGGSADMLVLKIIYEELRYLLSGFDWEPNKDYDCEIN